MFFDGKSGYFGDRTMEMYHIIRGFKKYPPPFSPLAGTKCAHLLTRTKYSQINKSQMAGKWQQSMLLKIIYAIRLQPETAVENITAVAL